MSKKDYKNKVNPLGVGLGLVIMVAVIVSNSPLLLGLSVRIFSIVKIIYSNELLVSLTALWVSYKSYDIYKKESAPYVYVGLEQLNDDKRIVSLSIKNYGKTSAYNVKIKVVDDYLYRYSMMHEDRNNENKECALSENSVIKQEINQLPPLGFRNQMLFNMSKQYKDLITQKPGKVVVLYTDKYNIEYREEYHIGINGLEHLSIDFPTGEEEALEKINKTLTKMIKKEGDINIYKKVNIYKLYYSSEEEPFFLIDGDKKILTIEDKALIISDEEYLEIMSVINNKSKLQEKIKKIVDKKIKGDDLIWK